MSLHPDHRGALLSVARASIEHGLARREALPVRAHDYDEGLRARTSCFVTLALASRLRGCIGSLRAHRPLVCDVARQAYGAAFSDPRFPAVTPAELPRLHIHLSVLSPPRPMTFRDETDLLGQLRPGIDGLTIERGDRHATFLPAVWQSLTDPRDFLDHLKRKAGFGPNETAETAARYTTESFGE